MKTTSKFLIALTLISTLFTTTSCVKDHTCECIIDGDSYTYSLPLTSNKKAKAECADYDATVKAGGLTPYDGCKLK